MNDATVFQAKIHFSSKYVFVQVWNLTLEDMINSYQLIRSFPIILIPRRVATLPLRRWTKYILYDILEKPANTSSYWRRFEWFLSALHTYMWPSSLWYHTPNVYSYWIPHYLFLSSIKYGVNILIRVEYFEHKSNLFRRILSNIELVTS